MSGGDAKSRMARILRLHEEIDAIKDDIKEIYAEEKADGGDKTAMGAAISIIRKREKDATKFDDQQGMVDVYLTTFLGTGTVVATHTHASEPQPTKAAGQAVTAHKPVVTSSVENEAAEISTPITEQQASPKPASDLTSSQAPQGEVATHSEAGIPVSNELPPASRGTAGEDDLRELAATVPGQIAQEGDAPLEASANVTGEGMSGHAAHLSTDFAEPDATPAGAVVANTSGVTGGESAATPSRADRIKALRPLCQRPEACGSSGGKKHCHSCVTAAESQEEIA